MKKDTLKQFLNVLFDKDDKINIAKNLYDTHLSAISSTKQGEFLAINALQDSRNDKNVTVYRTFLVEFDDLPLDEQEKFIASIGMPYSAKVYSGNKSYHYLICLDDPCMNLQIYSRIALWIHNILKISDESCKNPSRLTRFPGHIRKDTKKEQKLVELKGRVKSEDLGAWLMSRPDCKPGVIPAKEISKTPIDRKTVADDMNWYVEQYQKREFNQKGTTYVQCPLCMLAGKDTRKDNLAIHGTEMKYTCFSESSHNDSILQAIRELKKVNG